MYQDLRKEMVEFQIRERGISDKRVLQAMESIERERFAPLSLGSQVYHDAPQPIGESQTISQPYIVALMTQALELKPEGHSAGDRDRKRVSDGIAWSDCERSIYCRTVGNAFTAGAKDA